MRAEAQHAHAAQKAAVSRAAGHHHAAERRGLLHERLRRRVFVGSRRARPRQVEREQRQFRRRVHHDAGERRDAARRVERQRALLGDGPAKCRRAEQLHREPDAQPGKATRQLGPVLARIVEVFRMRHRRQIGGRGLVRGAQRGAVADEQRAGAVGQEHAFVRIEGQRIGARQPAQRVSQVIAQIEERPVRAVDVMPHSLAIAHVGNLIERIHGARVGRAGGGDDGARRQAGSAIGGNRLAQHVDAQAEAIVGFNRAHAVGHDAGELRRLQHGVMRLIGRVEHAAADFRAQVALARAHDGVEGGHRAAGGEQAARFGRKTHPVAQPVERVGFELHECRRRLPDAGITVRGVGDEVGERRRINAAARNVGEVAGTDRRE